MKKLTTTDVYNHILTLKSPKQIQYYIDYLRGNPDNGFYHRTEAKDFLIYLLLDKCRKFEATRSY